MIWRRKKRPFDIERFIRKAYKLDEFEIKAYEELYGFMRGRFDAVREKRLGIRLLVISDTHGYLAFDKARLPNFLDRAGEFDLCVLLGDLHPSELAVILDCIPRERIIAVKGNHDSFSVYSECGINDISGGSYEFNGVRFAGIDGSFRYKKEPFPSYTQYECLKMARKLPASDVLLTHDIMLSDFNRDPAHSGLIGISYYVYTNAPQWHIHGHIHKSYEKQYENGTKEKSVYLCEIVEL